MKYDILYIAVSLAFLVITGSWISVIPISLYLVTKTVNSIVGTLTAFKSISESQSYLDMEKTVASLTEANRGLSADLRHVTEQHENLKKLIDTRGLFG